jgi:predicted TIM-barrel fold metal-dependent hydrolase
VAHADFSQADIEEILHAHCAFANIRGIRQFVHEAYIDPANLKPCLLEEESWRKQVGLCEKYHLSFDLQIYYPQVEDAVQLVTLHPNLQFILTHTGLPAKQDDEEYMAGWLASMKRLSELPNLCVKLSGFGMFDRSWTSESIRPLVLNTIDAFGVDRCMFASNFPVDSLANVTYEILWSNFFEVVRNFSDEEKKGLFSRNARRVYRV